AAGAVPFVLNLCSSTTPMALAQTDLPELKRFTFVVSRRFEEGRERFRLHMGYFSTLAEAEEWLSVVREIYPGAWAGEAPGRKLRERATAAVAAQARHAAGPQPRIAPPPRRAPVVSAPPSVRRAAAAGNARRGRLPERHPGAPDAGSPRPRGQRARPGGRLAPQYPDAEARRYRHAPRTEGGPRQQRAGVLRGAAAVVGAAGRPRQGGAARDLQRLYPVHGRGQPRRTQVVRTASRLLQ